MIRRHHPPVVMACHCELDVGELASLAGFQLAHGDLSGADSLLSPSDLPAMAEHLRRSRQVLVVDGCAMSCGRKAMGRAGVESFTHLELGNLGLTKGHSPADEGNVRKVVEVAKLFLE